MAATGGRPLTDQVSSRDGARSGAPDDEREGASTEPTGTSEGFARIPRASVRPARPSGEDAPNASHDRLRTLPPASGELSETTTFRETLVSARRFGATLNGLLSAVDVFARGIEGARTANDALLKRLDGMKEQVNTAEQRVRGLEAEVAALKAELAKRDAAFAAERQFLTDEQDEFLRALLEEHEEELRSALNGAAPRPTSSSQAQSAHDTSDTLQSLRDKVDTLRAERERARELVQRMRAQRDGAQAELRRRDSAPDDSAPKTLPPSGVTQPTTPAPPPFAQMSRAPLQVDPHDDTAMLSNLGVVRLPRLSPPPAELAGVLHGSSAPRPKSSSAARAPTAPARKPAGSAPTPFGAPAARSGAAPHVAPPPPGRTESESNEPRVEMSPARPVRSTGPHVPTNPAIPSLAPGRGASLAPRDGAAPSALDED